MTSMGIDLGTTYSCVGICRGGNVDIIANEMGFKTTPSVVTYVNEEPYIGNSATVNQSMYPTQTIFDSKRMIGRTFDDDLLQKDMKKWPFKVIKDEDGKPKISVSIEGKELNISPEEISSLVLKKMSKIANSSSPTPIVDAVITVPAYFNDAQRMCTIKAGKNAGLNVLRIIDEPTAAAIAFGLNLKENSMALVFDLGGGTFDVTLLEIQDGIFCVKATDGSDHLGGQNIDNILVDYFADIFDQDKKCNIREDKRAIVILKQECEKVKKILTTNKIASIHIDSLHNGEGLHGKITRGKMEEMCQDLFEQCIGPISRVLRDGGIDADEVTDLVLVGGSSRIPYVREMLLDIFPHLKPYSNINPDEAVAYGAAFQAYKLVK